MLIEVFSRSIALFFLITLSPIFFIIIIACFLFQGLPIYYRQKRVGYHFSVFEIYKFRTMVNNSGKIITDPSDTRITMLGRFLRNTKIDEIPQLYNIIRGDMRFIGPRPEVPYYVDNKTFSFLKYVKPGMSDFASIILRNESKILSKIGGSEPYTELLPVKIELAAYYAKKKSFLLDLQLVIITTISIFLPNFAVKALAMPLIKLKSQRAESFINKFVIR